MARSRHRLALALLPLTLAACWQPGYVLVFLPGAVPGQLKFEVRDPHRFSSYGPFRVQHGWVFTCAAIAHESSEVLRAGTVWEFEETAANAAPQDRRPVRFAYGAASPAFRTVHAAFPLRHDGCYYVEIVVRARDRRGLAIASFRFTPRGLEQTPLRPRDAGWQ